MKSPISKVLTLLLLTALPLQAHAIKQRFNISEGVGNSVSFTSDAPVELIHGRTNKINGAIEYDDTFIFDAKHPFNINFAVDLASIDTGIPLRNEHMRDNFLETEKFPKAIFKVNKLVTTTKGPIKPGQVVNFMATGPFTIHGITVMKTIPVQVTNRGSCVRIQSHFPVAFKEHSIKRPEIVFQKLADTVFVDLDLQGTAAGHPKCTAPSFKK
jgi:polyisoprenoid-binding protein YceI